MANSDDEFTEVKRRSRKLRDMSIKTTRKNYYDRSRMYDFRPVYELLVCSIPVGTSEESLHRIFSEYGATKVELSTGGNSAYVTFGSWEQIQGVRKQADTGTGFPFEQEPLRVCLSPEARYSLEIYVGRLKHTVTETDLKHYYPESKSSLHRYPLDGADVNIQYHPAEYAGGFGYAFIAFGNPADAKAALEHARSHQITMHGADLIIRRHEPEEFKDWDPHNPQKLRHSFNG